MLEKLPRLSDAISKVLSNIKLDNRNNVVMFFDHTHYHSVIDLIPKEKVRLAIMTEDELVQFNLDRADDVVSLKTEIDEAFKKYHDLSWEELGNE